jgi:hypothetical protein
MKLQYAWSVSLLSVVKSVFRRVFSMLRGVGRSLTSGGSGTLPEFVLSYGMLPSPSRDPAVDAWLALKQERDSNRSKREPPSQPGKVLPLRGSVDEPIFRVTM